MTLEELQRLKVRWYGEAVRSGFIALCGRLAREKGEPLGSAHGPKYNWSGPGVDIHVDDYGGFMAVQADERLVCSTHPGTKLFVPGPWQQVVRDAAVDLEDHARENARRRERQEMERLARQLGVELEVA